MSDFSKNCFIILFTFLDGCPEGDGYVIILEKCYFIEKESLNWFDAKANCQNLTTTRINNNGTIFFIRKINAFKTEAIFKSIFYQPS